jgi:hypothetical protein
MVPLFGHLTRELSTISIVRGRFVAIFGLTDVRPDKLVEPMFFSFCNRCLHAGTGGERSRWMAARMRLNRSPLTVTSASWRVIARA